MGARNQYEVEAASAEVRGGLVYIPCPACRSAVALDPIAPETEPITYECSACGATFVVVVDR